MILLTLTYAVVDLDEVELALEGGRVVVEVLYHHGGIHDV